MPGAVSSSSYDLILIGSGQAGNPLAAAFAAKNKRVALVERSLVGGTCVNYGCTPTKTMVASAEVAALARRAPEFGVRVGEVSVSMQEVVARKRGIVETSRKNNETHLRESVDLLRGEASFTGPRQLLVQLNAGGSLALTANVIVIDTGLSPTLPDIDGIAAVPHLDNVSIMELDAVPEHLLILGGGYIGVEFAQMFRRFGSRVSILQHGSQLLTEEDPDVAEAVADLLREDDIQIVLDAKVESVSGSGTEICLTAVASGQARSFEGSHLLIAAGRRPNTECLNLAAAGIQVNGHGYIHVDERLQTNVPGVYATGDVTGGPQFTHIAYDDFRVLKTNLLDGGERVTTGRQVPYCVYIDPQLGRVGFSEKSAREAGRSFKVGRLPMTSVARAFETGQSRGFMKVLVDSETSQILGAFILGAEGGEIMSMLQIAMLGKLPYTVLENAIFAHPTFGESLNKLFAKLD